MTLDDMDGNNVDARRLQLMGLRRYKSTGGRHGRCLFFSHGKKGKIHEGNVLHAVATGHDRVHVVHQSSRIGRGRPW